jgi:flagellum-specific peptidoglycan hydrolase FlgJ
MANFVRNGSSISKQTLTVLANKALTVGLYGPINTYVTPNQELTVAINPASSTVTATPSKKAITANIREWTIKASASKTVTVEARAGTSVWDSFDLEVLPAAYALLTSDKRRFIADLASAGYAVAKQYRFPLSAMLACGCAESGYGTGKIYRRTGNPFNLQKPANWGEYPKCTTEMNNTENHAGQKASASPFCVAPNLKEAARMFCEWIAYFPAQGRVQELRAVAWNPKQFAADLYKVGFADNKKDKTALFAVLWSQFELGRFDSDDYRP